MYDCTALQVPILECTGVEHLHGNHALVFVAVIVVVTITTTSSTTTTTTTTNNNNNNFM